MIQLPHRMDIKSILEFTKAQLVGLQSSVSSLTVRAQRLTFQMEHPQQRKALSHITTMAPQLAHTLSKVNNTLTQLMQVAVTLRVVDQELSAADSAAECAAFIAHLAPEEDSELEEEEGVDEGDEGMEISDEDTDNDGDSTSTCCVS